MAGPTTVPVIDPRGNLVEIDAAHLPNALQYQGFTAPTEAQIQGWEQAQHYGGGSQQAITALEGVGRGVAGPAFDLAAQAAGITTAEDQLGRKEANPGTDTAGQAVGFVAPLAATALTGGAAAPVAGEVAASNLAARISAKTLPGLVTKLGASAAERFVPAAGAGVLRRAVPAGVDFAVQGAALAAANVADQAVLKDPKLSAESAVAEVGLGAALGGVLGFGGSAAVHGLAGVLGKAGEKAVDLAARQSGNEETYKLLASFKTDPIVRESVFKLDAAGITPNVLVPAHPETAKLLLSNADRVIALETKLPGLSQDVLVKATPEEAARILRDGEHIILGHDAYNQAGEALGAKVAEAFNTTDDTLSAALRGARSAEVETLAGKVAPEVAQGQLGSVFDEVTALAGKMRTETDLFNQGAARKLELLAEGLARDSGESSVDTFRRLNQAKRQLDDLASWGKKPSNNINEDTINAIRDLRSKVSKGLENEGVWGEAGARQKEVNKALSEYWTAQDLASKGPKGDPRRGFMVEVQQPDGSFVWEARPTRINEWLNAMGNGRSSAKTEGFVNYLDAGERLAVQLEKSGHEGAAELRKQLATIKADFLETEKKASVTSLVERLKNPGKIRVSEGYIPSARELAGQAAASATASLPGIGAVKGVIEGTLSKVTQPSFTIGVIDAFGKASARMGETIAGGVGRVFSGAAAEAAAKGSETVINASNYGKVAAQVRAHAADPQMLADASQKQTGPWSSHAPGASGEVAGIAARATQHLASKLPQEGAQAAFGAPYKPSAAELAAFNRAAKIAERPAAILEEIANGTVHPDHVQALSVIYPSIHREMSLQIMDRMAALTAKGGKVPFKTQMGLTLFLGGNVNGALAPASMAANQAVIAQARRDEQTGNVEPGSRSLEGLGVAGRMSTPMQASASRSS